MSGNRENRPTEIDPRTGCGLEYIERIKKESESPEWRERALQVRAMTKVLFNLSPLTTEERQALDRRTHEIEQDTLHMIGGLLDDLWSNPHGAHLKSGIIGLSGQTREEFLKRWNALMEFLSSKTQAS